jgi:hypothetical protein
MQERMPASCRLARMAFTSIVCGRTWPDLAGLGQATHDSRHMLAGFRGLYGDCPDMGRRRRALRIVDGSCRPWASPVRQISAPLRELDFVARLCYFININVCVSQRSTHQKPVRNAHANSPCCLPQERQPTPCYPGAGSGSLLFDLHCLMVDWTGDFRHRIEFCPCSQGGRVTRPCRRGCESPPGRRSRCIEEFAGVHAPASIAADAGQPR